MPVKQTFSTVLIVLVSIASVNLGLSYFFGFNLINRIISWFPTVSYLGNIVYGIIALAGGYLIYETFKR